MKIKIETKGCSEKLYGPSVSGLSVCVLQLQPNEKVWDLFFKKIVERRMKKK
jgi:hypothetical protein